LVCKSKYIKAEKDKTRYGIAKEMKCVCGKPNVISWFDTEDPDGNEMRWYQVLTSDTQVRGERQQP